MGELKVYFTAFKAVLITRFEYRLDLALSLLGSLAFQLSPVTTYAVIVTQLPDLAGWSPPQVLFLFGLWAVALSISELFFDHVWYVPDMVIQGQFDRLLVYPVHSLPFFLITEPQVHAISNFFIGTGMLIYAGLALNFEWWVWPLLYFWALCGAFIYAACLVLVSTLLIAMPGKGLDIGWLVLQASQATRFPLDVFPKVVKASLLTVLPLGTYLFLPGEWLFHGASPALGLLAPPLVAITVATLAWLAWEKALQGYESTGS